MPYFGPVSNTIPDGVNARYVAPGGGFGGGSNSSINPNWSFDEVVDALNDFISEAGYYILGSTGQYAPISSGISSLEGEVHDAESFVVPDEPQVNSDGTLNETAVENSLEGGWSLSDYMQNHPGATYEDIMREASLHSDEFAEKYLDYLVERGELDRANAYTANREDTAYQRLVADLKAAGLNPAMMYGSSASPSSASSQGYIRMTEGANSRDIGNYSKLKKLMLTYLGYMIQKELGEAGIAAGFLESLIPSWL